AHVTAVDYFDGRGTPTPKDTLTDFHRNLQRYGVADKVEACHPDSEPPRLAYDLLFIDGDHSREAVEADVQKYLPYLAPDGVMAFHDYNEPCHPGVTEVVSELLAA